MGCARAVLRTDVPDDAVDEVRHCLATGFIARRCSVGEAYLVGVAKELKDAFGPGNLEWRDWQADRAGVRCARASHSDAELRTCCESTPARSANRSAVRLPSSLALALRVVYTHPQHSLGNGDAVPLRVVDT